MIQEGRKKLKSALKNGYHSLIDRYELDLQHRVRMIEAGRREADMLRMELCANLVLAAPKQSQAQRTLGVGLGSTSESRIARLAYVKMELEFMVLQLKDALTSRWIIMFQGMPYSPRAFVHAVLEQDKPRSIGCWKGVIHPTGRNEDELRQELDWVFGQNERAAWNSVEFSRNESGKHLARNAERYASNASYASPAARRASSGAARSGMTGTAVDGEIAVEAAAVANSQIGGGVKNAPVMELHVQMKPDRSSLCCVSVRLLCERPL